MAGSTKGNTLRFLVVFLVVYAFLITAVWALGMIGPRMDFWPLAVVVASYIPAVVTLIIWLTRLTPRKNEDPSVERLRKTLESEKLQSEAIIGALDDPVLIMNKDGIIKHVNSAMLRMMASSEKELLEKHYTKMVSDRVSIVSSSSDTPRLSYNITQVFKTGEPVFIEHERVTYADTGTFLDISIALLPLKNEEGHISALMITAHDITSLVRSQRKKDEFIARACREFDASARPLSDSLRQIMLNPAGLSEAHFNEIKKTDEAMSQLGLLIKDIDDLTRLSMGEYENKPKFVTMSEVFAHATNLAAAKYSSKYITATSDISTPSIVVDEQRLQVVLDQLIDNAYKFTPDKGAVTLRAVSDGAAAVIEIADTGTGIPEEKRAVIFDEFVKLDESAPQTGTGLGLAICKKIVDDWKGTIKISSQEIGGVVVTFTIPGALAQNQDQDAVTGAAFENIEA